MCGDIEASVPAPAPMQSERASERVMLGGRGEFLLVEGPHGLEERDPMYSDHPSFPDPWKPELAERVRSFEPVPGLLALYNGVDARFTVYDDVSCAAALCERVHADAVLPPWVAQDRRFREHLVVWNTGRYRIFQTASQFRDQPHICLLYTSDAADE